MSARWEIEPPRGFPNPPLARLYTTEHREPTDDDAPPVSVLPMTRAARQALRLSRMTNAAFPREDLVAARERGV